MKKIFTVVLSLFSTIVFLSQPLRAHVLPPEDLEDTASCELLLTIGSYYYFSNSGNENWLEFYYENEEYPFYSFVQPYWYEGEQTLSIPVSADVPIRVVWHNPDSVNNGVYFSLFDPSIQHVVFSKYLGQEIADGQIVTYTPDCGASCGEADKCPLHIHLRRTPNSNNTTYSVNVYLGEDEYLYTTLSLDPSDSQFDTTLYFCPERQVRINSGQGGADFTCTITDAFGRVTETNEWAYYVNYNVCAEQCELMLQIGADTYLNSISEPNWLLVYAGDEENPYERYFRTNCHYCNDSVTILVSAGVPLRFVWNEPDATNHNSWFNIFDPSTQQVVFSKYPGQEVADGQIATYTPDCGASCGEDGGCPLHIHLERTPYLSNTGYSAEVYLLDTVSYTVHTLLALNLSPSQSQLDTTLYLCSNRWLNIVSSGGDDFICEITDNTGQVFYDNYNGIIVCGDSVQEPTYDGIVYVTETGAGTHSGDSWANAVSSIEEAQTIAQANNAVVWVAAGTYYGDTISNNAFTMKSGVNVFGGFAGDEPADYDLSLRDFIANATILDGQNARRVLCQQVNFAIETSWDGFTIQHGRTIESNNVQPYYMASDESLDGGGVFLSNKGNLINCIVTQNHASGSGGGIRGKLFSKIINCKVVDNSASYGGGIRVYASDVSNCIISNNSATLGGGILYGYSSISNCEITHNTATNGGGVFQDEYNPAIGISNSLIANNTATGSGGGIYARAASASITNSTIVCNSSGIYGSTYTHITNCILWGNKSNGFSYNITGSLTCSYSAIEGGYAGDGIITLSELNPPLFVNPSINVGANDSTSNVDWHLLQSSPCINTGDNSVVTDSLDLDGNPRVYQNQVDMGCYEWQGSEVIPIGDGQPCADAPTVTDYDEVVYNTVKIGNQCWMKENLRTTHYSDGTIIPLGGYSSSMPYRYCPNNNCDNVPAYGYLYNWSSVMHGMGSNNTNTNQTQGVCPEGWHVPSAVEWTQLLDYVKGQSVYLCGEDSNNIAKALANTLGWTPSQTECAVGNDVGQNNITGFGAMPAGNFYGPYDNFKGVAFFWTASDTAILPNYNTYSSDPYPIFYAINQCCSGVESRTENKAQGFSVRCLKNDSLISDYSGIIYVTPSGAGTHSGNSWANAISSIDSAQTLAEEHNAVVWVAAGTYYGDTTAVNAFTMHDGVNVYGGFAGNEPADYDLSLRDFEANETVLDGQNARRVLLQPMEFERTTEWNGFTMRHGRVTTMGGAGAYLQTNGKLSDCVVENNQAIGAGGGGIYGVNSVIHSCTVKNNSSNGNGSSVNNGGGICASNSSITDCRISYNTLYNPHWQNIGGGIYLTDHNSVLKNCIVTHNTSSGDGGGAFVARVDSVKNCIVTHNTSSMYGGGLVVNVEYTPATVSNCIIANNFANLGGNGICTWCYYANVNIANSTIVRNSGNALLSSSNGRTNVYNSIFWGNGSNFSGDVRSRYSAISGGSGGNDNIVLDNTNQQIRFMNPSLTLGPSDATDIVDWHLQEGSVCINHGDNSAVTDSFDLDGNPRIKYDTVDMGCYEFDYDYVPIVEYDSIIYVTVTGAGNHSGNSWANAISSIDSAQTLAEEHNAVVWVASGTYYGDTTAVNAFTMHDGVNVYGGFAGNEPADYDLSLRDFEANETVLDGQNARRVLCQQSDFNTETTWDGFTIRNGRTLSSGSQPATCGGGVLLKNGNLGNCIIKDNYAYSDGGGIYVWCSSSKIRNCKVVNNYAEVYGGGIYVVIYNPVLISNCLVSNNKANSGGGGICSWYGDSYLNVVNTTIVNNAGGAGVYSSRGHSNYHNCIVWGNNSSYTGNINCTYSAVQGGCSGEGNINLSSQNTGDGNHPFFVNPTQGRGPSYSGGDWHLMENSACVNKGSNAAVVDSLDLDGKERIMRGIVDMGCYEFAPVDDSVYVEVHSNNAVWGSVTGSGLYFIGDTVTIQATPNLHARFVRWSDNDTANPRYVVLNSDTTFEAVFELLLPELHVTSISHSELIGGTSATVTWTVQNDGTTSTPNGEVWYDRLWLSLEPKVDVNNSNPIYLGEVQNVAALAPGEYYTQTKNVWIPLEISGDYYLFVISDAYDADHIYWDSVAPIPYNPPAYIPALSHNCYGENCGNYAGNRILEMSEYENYSSYPYYHDNFFYEQVDITMCPLPDLIVTSVSPATQNFFSGSEVMLTYQVVNDGDYNTRVADWYDMVFISNHDVFDDTAQLLKTIPRTNAIRKRIPDPNPHTPVAPVNSNQKGASEGIIINNDSIDIIVYQGPLDPDSSYQRTFSVNVPLEMYGTAYFYVYTDYYNQVYEHVGQFNNVTRSDSVNIYLTPPADLVPQNIMADNTVSTGATFNYSYEIHNQGAGNPNQSAWNDRCYLSTSADSMVNAIEISVDHHSGGSFPAGGYYSIQKSITLPPNITSGTYYLFVLTDANNNVFEYLYEDNNLSKYSQPISVVQPDLQILSLNVEDTLSAGSEVGISYLLANTGDGAIINRNVKDGFYLSQYPDGSNAISLPQFTSNLWLNAHDSTMKYQNVMIPGNLQDGNYYLFARTNIENTLNETSTGNNISPIQQVYVVHRPLPDLVITSVSLPDTIVAGSSINFTAVLSNQGDIAVNINLVDYKLTVAAANNDINCPIDSTSTATLSLAAGATTTVNLTATILPSVSANPSSFTLTVNPNHSIVESNYSNNGYAFTHSVQPYPFDMAVTHLTSQDQTISGEYIPVEWFVENIGSAVSNVSLWYDRIYLSTDSLFDANDIQIGSYTRNQLLNAGDSYTVSTNYQIPVAADGDYYVLAVSDATQETFDCLRTNNVRGRPISITQSTLPDLQMDSLVVNNTLTTGQACMIHFSVSNEGEHITHNDRWTDAFYLNNQPSLNNAVLLGSKVHNGQLDAFDQYTDYISVIIPNTWIGNCYLLGFTDATDQVVEMNSDSNNLFILPVSVARPLPSDLTVLPPDFPDSVTVGEDIEVSWTLRNIGLNVAQGNIKDAVYLSTDSVWSSDDIMLGSMEHDVNLSANGQELRNASLTLQGVPVGNYYVIVKTNILNALNENSYTNNSVASLTTLHVDYPSLYINQEEQLQLESSQTVYYKLEVGPEYEHQTLSCKLTSPTQNVMNSLYVAYSSAPSTSNFNWSATMPYVQEQEILIPSLEQGTYYIMAKGHTTDNSTQAVNLLASIINFEIISVNANSGTNTGSVTTQIIGAKFDTIMDFRLANSNSYLPAEKVFFHNSTESYATFNLRDQETGVYDMVAELPGGIITVKGQAFVVEQGLPAELLSNIIAPASVRNGNTFTVTIEYGNNGSTDLNISGFLLVSTNGFPIAFSSDSLANNATELTFETGEPNGNPDVIRPGHFATKTIFVKANRVGNINLKLYPIRRQY